MLFKIVNLVLLCYVFISLLFKEWQLLPFKRSVET